MTKIVGVLIVLIIAAVVYFLQNDVKNLNLNVDANVYQIEKNDPPDDRILPFEERPLDKFVSTSDALEHNQIKISNNADSHQYIDTEEIEGYCEDIMDCELIVVDQMRNRFGFYDFVYSPTNDLNKEGLSDKVPRESRFVKIGELGKRDVYAFEVRDVSDGIILQKMNLDYESYDLLNDEYMVVFDDEITISRLV